MGPVCRRWGNSRLSAAGGSDALTVPTTGLPLPRRHWATVALATGIVMTVLDGSMVVVMLPVIADSFAVAPSRAVWVMTAYQLTLACLLLPIAAIGEKYGHWRVHCGGLALFALGAIFSATSTSLETLIAGRVLQGIGAAGVHSMTMALLRHSYPPQLFGRAAGVNSSIVGLAMAVGPSAGALVLIFAEWRTLFLIVLPVAALSLVVALASLPRISRRSLRADLVSGALTALAIFCLVMGLNELRADSRVIRLVGFLGASAALFGFLVYRLRGRPDPVLPIDLFAVKAISLTLIASICVFAAQAATLISLPFHLSRTTDLSPGVIGLTLTPMAISVALVASTTGRLSDRYSPRLLCGIGASIMTAGLVLLLLMPARPEIWDVLWRVAVCGVGFGMFNTPNSRFVMMTAPLPRASAGGSLVAESRMLGQSIGATFTSIVFSYWPGMGGTGAFAMAACLTTLALIVSTFRGKV